MNLTTRQQAALTSGLSHPNDIITASEGTARALQHRGLVVGRQLTEQGRDEARACDASFLTCAKCDQPFPMMRSLPTTGRDLCPACIRELCVPITRHRNGKEQRAEWSRQGTEMFKLGRAGHYDDMSSTRRRFPRERTH